MSNYRNGKRLRVKVYFTDSPSPVEIENVMHINTEGGLLRIITVGEGSQWWPLCNVFNIRELPEKQATLPEKENNNG